MSRNRDRMGAGAPENNSPPPQALQENPGFSFVVPTEFVELPSGGKYYPEGHPLYGQDTIEIKQMTAKEEDILTSPNLIEKGIVLDKLLESIIVTEGVKLEDFVVGDKNTLLVSARILGYGKDYPVNYNDEEINIDLTTLKEIWINEKNLVEPHKNEFKFTTPIELSWFLIIL